MAKETDGAVESAGLRPPSEADRPPDEPTARDQAVIQEVRERFQLVTHAEQEQRRQERDDLYFDGVDQWQEDVRASRQGGEDPVTGNVLGPKPTLTINIVDVPIQQVMTDARNARLGVTVQSRTALASQTARHFQGVIRTIQADSGADAARLWALERTLKAGRGAYRIGTRYISEQSGETPSAAFFDQEIVLERILDQGTVYWDPYAEAADRSDANWCLLTSWMSLRERTRRWSDVPVTETDSLFAEDQADDWYAVNPATRERAVRIAHYYRVGRHVRMVAHHRDHGVRFLDEMPKPVQELAATRHPSVRVRPFEARWVDILVVDGERVLEQRRWPGRYIPIIATVGKEYLVEGQRLWKGVVCKVKDVSRALNVMVSSIVEMVGRMPRTPYMMAEGQDEGYEDEWDTLYTANRTRLHYKPLDIEGKPSGPPQRQDLEPQIQGLMVLVRMLQDLFQAITGSVDPTARASYPYDRSGRAIEALQRQGDSGNANYLDTLARVSMMHEGRVLVDLIPHIYDRPGRLLQIAGGDHDQETPILIKRPFIRGPHGQPAPVPCPTCGGGGQIDGAAAPGAVLAITPTTCPTCGGDGFATGASMPDEWEAQTVEYVDFADGQYRVNVEVGRLQQTQQAEAVTAMVELAKAAPNLVPFYADILFRAMGVPSLSEAADRIQRAMPAAGGDDEQLPPAAAARFRTLEQEHAQAVAALQAAQRVLETDQIKAQGQQEIAALKAAAQQSLEEVKQQGALLRDAAKGAQAKDLEALRASLQAMQAENQRRHERVLVRLEQLGKERIERMETAGKLALERVDQQGDREIGSQPPADTAD